MVTHVFPSRLARRFPPKRGPPSPSNALYRLRRFAWRQRWPLAAASVLLLGAGFLFERERQLQQVIAERGKAQALADFMIELFANADPSRSRGEQITVREVLDRGAIDLRARSDLPPDIRADLLMAMAEANHGLALGEEVEPDALEDALNRLARLDERQARIVDMRFFAGLTGEQIAAATGLSTATVQREWRMARAWLQRELETAP